MRILVFTPTWRGVHPDCEAALRPQLVDGVEWVVDDRNPFPPPDYRNIRVKMQDARQRILDSNAEALLTVDADCVIPPDGIRRILDTPGDVVYAPTMIRHGAGMLSLWQYCGDRNIGMSLSNYPDELAKARKAGLWRVAGVGWSMTLIRRHVLDALDFRDDNAGQACDIPFAEDCLRAGFVAMANMNLAVEHIDQDRNERLHPWMAASRQLWVASQTVNVVAAGRWMALKANASVELTPAEAQDLLRAGYIQPLTEPETAVIDGSETAVLPKRRIRK